MCSIAGSAIRDDVEQMLSIMKHRAPDGSKVHTADYSLGMGRLAVIDLTTPNLTPFRDKNLTVVLNGEIFNYQELREQLSEKYDFSTTSDIEVLAKAYREWGHSCVDHLNGMFAFAISDGKTIFLARDIAGEKPLYYREHPFVFASEAKALNFDCEEFPPAMCATYDIRKDTLDMDIWWELPDAPVDPSSAESTLEELLEDAVRIRTRADVPYGLYLSGGIDSTLISTFHNFEHTYFFEKSDETEYKSLAQKLVYHLDGPTTHFSPYALYKLAEQAHHDGVKVILTGDGADELFGGYVRYIPNHLNRLLQKKYPSYKGMFPVKQMEWEEFNGNLRELLRIGDRMASAFGIENRSPFLDRRIIEFAYNLPNDLKYEGFDGKMILRNILKRRKLEYEFEEKHGFYVPVNAYIGEKDPYDKTKNLSIQKQHFERIKKNQRYSGSLGTR